MPSTTTPITSSSTTSTTDTATAAAGTLPPTNTEGLTKAAVVAAIHTLYKQTSMCITANKAILVNYVPDLAV